MKIWLILEDGTRVAIVPGFFDGKPCAESTAACPRCSSSPLRVVGTGRHIDSHDTYRAAAVALCCSTQIGSVFAKVETIFGLEEDEAVLVHGRARVYG